MLQRLVEQFEDSLHRALSDEERAFLETVVLKIDDKETLIP
ncbi:hypothetical protein ACE1TH_11170 [Shouchella sp. JSM 1781072]